MRVSAVSVDVFFFFITPYAHLQGGVISITHLGMELLTLDHRVLEVAKLTEHGWDRPPGVCIVKSNSILVNFR